MKLLHACALLAFGKTAASDFTRASRQLRALQEEDSVPDVDLMMSIAYMSSVGSEATSKSSKSSSAFAGDPAIRVKRVRVEQSYPSPYGLNNDNRSTLTLSEVQVFEASKTMWGSTVNVAQGKSATQSSTYQVNSSFGPPSFAVDGNTDTFNHVDFTTGQAWWEVDLGQTYDVSRIIIHFRKSCCQYQNTNARVKLYNGSDEVVHSYSIGDTTNLDRYAFHVVPYKSLRESLPRTINWSSYGPYDGATICSSSSMDNSGSLSTVLWCESLPPGSG